MHRLNAAALALLGWYLMLPPKGAIESFKDEPLRNWEQFSAFDRADQCEATALRHLEARKGENDVLRWAEARCIASDDPRLTK